MPICKRNLADKKIRKVQSAGEKLDLKIVRISIILVLGILALLLGGIILNSLSWRWAFYINIPICFITFLLTISLVPRDVSPKVKMSFDLIGILLLSPMFALFIYGISQVGTYGGFGNTGVLVPVLLGVLLLAAFVFYALRTKNKQVIDVRFFCNRCCPCILPVSDKSV